MVATTSGNRMGFLAGLSPASPRADRSIASPSPAMPQGTRDQFPSLWGAVGRTSSRSRSRCSNGASHPSTSAALNGTSGNRVPARGCSRGSGPFPSSQADRVKGQSSVSSWRSRSTGSERVGTASVSSAIDEAG
jgi:hypothetical protein